MKNPQNFIRGLYRVIQNCLPSLRGSFSGLGRPAHIHGDFVVAAAESRSQQLLRVPAAKTLGLSKNEVLIITTTIIMITTLIIFYCYYY